VKNLGNFAGFFLNVDLFVTKMGGFVRHLPRIPLIWEAIVARVEPIGYPRL
jgi:hypothetical protein